MNPKQHRGVETTILSMESTSNLPRVLYYQLQVLARFVLWIFKKRGRGEFDSVRPHKPSVLGSDVVLDFATQNAERIIN
jgi:hypothetical protein